MGKIVKFCASCDEGFAERFGFCPNCGGKLEAFQMNPIEAESKADDADVLELDAPEISAPVEEPPSPAFVNISPADGTSTYIPPSLFADDKEYDEMIADESNEVSATEDLSSEAEEEAFEIPQPEVVQTAGEDVEETVESTAHEADDEEPVYNVPVAPPVYTTPAVSADQPGSHRVATNDGGDDGGFHVTVIEEKNGKQRNGLLLAAMGLMILTVGTGTLYSLFAKSLDLAAIEGGDIFVARVIDEAPQKVEIEEQPKQNDKEGGGGGGGGREDKTETSQGDLADQTRDPNRRPPDAKIPRIDNPSLPLPPPATEGDQKTPKQYNRWGDPNSTNLDPSNGTGRGGGQGSGTGTGQGSGRGTGAGNGEGSGLGNGRGNGNGDGNGPGTGVPPPPREPERPKVTVNYKILSKPRANYTPAGRENNIQGNVRVRVELLASGAVGRVTPVTRLPHGLTEQAIAAAKQIRFTPKMVDGRPQSVTVAVDYSFTIY